MVSSNKTYRLMKRKKIEDIHLPTETPHKKLNKRGCEESSNSDSLSSVLKP